MSFFKKLFGGTSFAEERAEGDEAFEARRWAEARLAYQRALDKARDGDAVEECTARVGECLDRMAEARMVEAEGFVEAGHLDLAEAELKNAMELASSDDIVKKARRRFETLEQEDAVRQAAELPDEMSDEDRWALLAGSWGEEQLEEYDEYGDEFRDALLALHDEKTEAALELFEALLEEWEEPVYLWLEVGRARAQVEDWEGAEEALREFLDRLEEDEGGTARMAALASLAALRDKADDEEGAIGELAAAMEAFPDEPGPFLLMGRFLLDKGHHGEAAEVLESGVDLLDPDRPDWRYLEALGIAHHENGDDVKAASYLDRVLLFFVSLRRHDRELDYPPPTAVLRASIYEADGQFEKAADLYRGLASGSDVANHLTYHREAARVLLEIDLDDEARRMLTRALALAKDDEEALAEIEAQLEELE